jgi:antitoxin VapB
MSSTVTAGIAAALLCSRYLECATATNDDCTRNIPGGLHHIRYHYTVALNIKDEETERLAAEVARLAHESKTHAVRVSLRERRERLLRQPAQRADRLTAFLTDEVWPQLPAEVAGRAPDKAEREAILGYGPEGV